MEMVRNPSLPTYSSIPTYLFIHPCLPIHPSLPTYTSLPTYQSLTTNLEETRQDQQALINTRRSTDKLKFHGNSKDIIKLLGKWIASMDDIALGSIRLPWQFLLIGGRYKERPWICHCVHQQSASAFRHSQHKWVYGTINISYPGFRLTN